GPVDGMLTLVGSPRHRQVDDQQRQAADRQVDVEDPAPGGLVDDEAADERADDRGGRERGSDQPLVAAAVARRDDVADGGEREREEAAGPQTLDTAEDDQLGHVLGEAAERRADEED